MLCYSSCGNESHPPFIDHILIYEGYNLVALYSIHIWLSIYVPAVEIKMSLLMFVFTPSTLSQVISFNGLLST